MHKVAEGVYRIPARAANTYLVEASKGLVLVDTGLPGSEKRILKAIARLGRTPSDLKLVLLTHRHLDHIGSAAALKKQTGAKLASHPFEKPYAAGTLVISVPSAWSFYGRIVRKLTTLEYWSLKLFRIIKFQTAHVDLAADEESVLDAVGLDGSVLWTPGHTKGSVTLFLNQPNVAIMGVGGITKQPLVITDKDGTDSIAIRSVVHLTLGYDHRVVDGAVADQFMAVVKKALENWSEEVG